MLETLYEDTAAVYCRGKVVDPVTGITSTEDVELYSALKCRLSYKSQLAAGDARSADTVTQQIKLFYAPEVELPAGCLIVITRQGVETAYRNSGQEAIYPTHRETNLELEKEFA